MVGVKYTEMPKNCKHCTRKPICKVYAVMFLNEPYSFNKDERPDDCPLVEIITCKDCTNWDKRHYRGNTCYCGMRMRHTEPDEFCENAERREVNDK